MEEEKKKHDFGKGFLVGGLVGLGVGVAGTCVAAALMSDDEPEIEDQEDEQTEESEAENAAPGFISSIVNAAEKAGNNVSESDETTEEESEVQRTDTDC
jgi:hypothetical protein